MLPAPGPGPWQEATVVATRTETATARTIRLQLPAPARYLAGQHYLVRLTAPDGYQATRSYSVASAPDGRAVIELTVERLPDGEVSTYLHDELRPGDLVEVRGPIGGWFVWAGDTPALLLGGGSGVAPLMAMLRLARRRPQTQLTEPQAATVHLVVSVRRQAELYYREELPGPEVTVVYTREAPAGDRRGPGRLRPDDLPEAIDPATVAYVCGSSGFVEHATEVLGARDVSADRIRVERFGPSA